MEAKGESAAAAVLFCLAISVDINDDDDERKKRTAIAEREDISPCGVGDGQKWLLHTLNLHSFNFILR